MFPLCQNQVVGVVSATVEIAVVDTATVDTAVDKKAYWLIGIGFAVEAVQIGTIVAEILGFVRNCFDIDLALKMTYSI